MTQPIQTDALADLRIQIDSLDQQLLSLLNQRAKVAEKVGEILTDTGLEVEGIEKIESVKGGLKGVVIGEVLTCVQHPNADRLKVCDVDVGEKEIKKVVCGAPNAREGLITIYAPPGAVVPKSKVKLVVAKIRDVISYGMLCSESELNLSDESDGITGNKDGGFDYKSNKTQWKNNISEDPKKIFSTTKKAIDFIERKAQSKEPFFLQVSHYAVHSDIMLRKETLKKYKNRPKGKYQKHEGFAAMTEDLDTGVGMLLDRVKALGLEGNTYIIYTSDNGAVPVMPPKRFYKVGSNFPLSRGKWDAMEGGIRVPFIIAGPKIKAGIEAKTPITFSDLLPTITDIAGYKLPLQDDLDGGSLKNILTKDGIGKVTRISEGLIFHVPYENGIAIKRAHSAIIVDNFKLIKFYNNNELLLFDIKNDIKEKNNLAASLPEKVTQLEVLLDNYLSKVKAPKWQPGISWKNKTLEKFNSYH